MGAQFTRSLGEILRSTLQKLEETPDFRQDDNAVIELKKHIVRAIAELEIAKSAHSAEPTGKANGPGGIVAPVPSAESGTPATAMGMSASSMEPEGTPSSSPETVVSEPVSDMDVPLLAENGTATAT